MTSHDVVAQLRKMTGVKQIGHAGTLDPMAVGVLPVAIGAACRLLRFLSTDKTYLAEFLLGVATTTDDIEGDILAKAPVEECVIHQLKPALASFIGDQQQKPPAYSAVRYGGKHLYELARSGKTPVDIVERNVTIDSIELTAVELPILRLRIKCSKGTYIRAIARDLGKKLGLGSCLKSLVREKSGPFLIEQAFTLECLSELAANNRLLAALIAPEQILAMSVVTVDRNSAKSLATGQYLSMQTDFPANTINLTDDKLCLVMFEQSLIALCRVTANKLHPEVVIRNAKSLV